VRKFQEATASMHRDELFYSLEGPLEALPGERQMRAANLAGFGELARSAGVDPARLLERHGIEPRSVRDPDSFLDCRSVVDLLEDCGSRFNDPLFGLKLAERQAPEVYGCVAALCRSAATLGEAVEAWVEYLPVVHSPEAQMELRVGRDTAELCWGTRTDLGVNDQANYQAFVLNTQMLRALGGPRFKASYARLATDVRPKDIPEIEARLGCAVRGRAEVNAIAFPTEALRRPVATSNRLLFRLVGGYLARVKAASRIGLVDRVEDYVRGALPSGGCSIENCAEKLGISVRTLQAQLARHGVRFSELLERRRIELAKEHLRAEALSLDEVAALLGYSEQTSFGRAFKRWTGSTPQRFRTLSAGA
jgi:AraC-like DNA-binding protein